MCKRMCMCMTTKTITIMDDAYNLLADHKLENESFSEEIRRVLSKKKTKKLSDFFGLLSKEVGEPMIKDYKRIRRDQIKLTKERLKAINR